MPSLPDSRLLRSDIAPLRTLPCTERSSTKGCGNGRFGLASAHVPVNLLRFAQCVYGRCAIPDVFQAALQAGHGGIQLRHRRRVVHDSRGGVLHALDEAVEIVGLAVNSGHPTSSVTAQIVTRKAFAG